MEIRHVSGKTLYVAKDATSIKQALEEAVSSEANLRGANLDGANLGGAGWTQVADLLEKALHGMNDSGRHWIKGSLRGELEDGSATYCSIGSVEAHGEGTARALALWLLGSVAGGDIAAFNDHPDTTWDDVVVVFNIAVKHARRFAA